MYCSNCGTKITDDSFFCVVCGAKINSVSQIPQQTKGQMPYRQMKYGQSPDSSKSKKRKVKPILLITGGAALLIAIALVVFFVVFAGDGWPLSGNTVQTRFINDAVQVFSGAVPDISAANTERVLTEPFDIELELTGGTSGYTSDVTAAFVYDEQKLGIYLEPENSDSTVLLLDEDTIYTSSYGYVGGLRFDNDTDLSNNMTLMERIAALLQSVGSEYDIDNQKLLEMLINSINEDCFVKKSDTTKLTLDMDDLVDALDTFSDKLDEDEALSDQLEDMIDDMFGTSIKASSLISLVSSQLKAEANEIDFKLVWAIRYDGSVPVGMELSYDDGSDYDSFTFQFEYENTSDGKNITLDVTSGSMKAKGELSVAVDGSDINLNGKFVTYYGGEQYFSYKIKGSASAKGEDIEGSFKVTDDNNSIFIDYDGTMVFGMPEDMVEDDDRFDIETRQAYVQNISDMFNLDSIIYRLGLSTNSINDFVTYPQSSESPSAVVSESAEPVVSTYAEILVGITMPTKSQQRWNEEGANLKAALESLGYEVDLQYADDMVDIQYAQIENQIAMGCDVLVIAAVDSSALGNVLTKAKESGICVVAYDKLLTNTDAFDYYVTFSNYDAGKMQGEYIVQALGLEDGETGPFTIECFAGSPDDASANLLYQGAMDVLWPYIDNGTLVVRSGQTDLSVITIQSWSSVTAQIRMEDLIMAYYTDENLDIVLSPNDSIALGISSSLKAAGYGSTSKPFPIITGMDCDVDNVKQIIAAEQSMSVYKDISLMTKQVVLMVDALVSGKEVTVNAEYDNGIISVPSYVCDFGWVDADNYYSVLVDSGYYTEEELGF